MVRKTIISILITCLLQACSEKKITFNREKEVLNVLNELGLDNEKSYLFLVVRSRCDFCNSVAKEIFNRKQMEAITLTDSEDSSFHSSKEEPVKKIIVKSSQFFESRGVDFGQNYLFIINKGEIRNFSIITKETKDKLNEMIESEKDEN